MADSSILDLVEEINSVRAQLAEAKQSAADLATENKRLAPFEGKFEALTTEFATLQEIADARAVGAGEAGQKAEDALKAQAKAEKAQAKAEAAAAKSDEAKAAADEENKALKAQVEDLEGQIRTLTQEVETARPFVAAAQSLKAVLADVG